MIAFTVDRVTGGFQALKLTLEKNRIVSREPICEPCHKSLAYQYLVAHMNRQLVDDMIADANKQGSKQAPDA